MQYKSTLLLVLALTLIIFGGTLIYSSGYFTEENLALKQPMPQVTTIVVTQTRRPAQPFLGKWTCKEANKTNIEIRRSENFYDVIIGTDSFKATENNNELLVENGSIFTLNNKRDLLLVKVDADSSFFCVR